MVGSRVMLTPNGFDVSLRVSRIASRKAFGEGWVRAVRIPVAQCVRAVFGDDVWDVRTKSSSFRDSSSESRDANPMNDEGEPSQ